jgi:hypothetical protein
MDIFVGFRFRCPPDPNIYCVDKIEQGKVFVGTAKFGILSLDGEGFATYTEEEFKRLIYDGTFISNQ